MSEKQPDTLVHLLAGGIAGTVSGTILCPLDVVRTRLQSSKPFVQAPPPNPYIKPKYGDVSTMYRFQQRRSFNAAALRCGLKPQLPLTNNAIAPPKRANSMGIWQCLRHIVHKEGVRGLFKGLGPNLVGIAPSRAIYFGTYSNTKQLLNNSGFVKRDSTPVHLLSAAAGGFVTSSITNPIWVLKTRLQLDCNAKVQMNVRRYALCIYAKDGIRGFYKGLSACYVGVSETMIYFAIYEYLKAELVKQNLKRNALAPQPTKDCFVFMTAGAAAKVVASCLAYPHEVVRTRLREGGNKYRGFFQTLKTVWLEEGRVGLYRGLTTQLVRQMPNAAIVMGTYEAVVYLLSSKSTNAVSSELTKPMRINENIETLLECE